MENNLFAKHLEKVQVEQAVETLAVESLQRVDKVMAGLQEWQRRVNQKITRLDKRVAALELAAKVSADAPPAVQ